MYGLWKNEGKYGRVWLDRFFIDKIFQNKGYAHIVLPILLNKIKNTYGYNKLYLSVYKNNEKAIRLYKSFGFEFNGELDINGELVMVKKFQEDKK